MEQLFQFRWWVPDDWLAIVNTLGPPLARAVLLALLTWYFAGLARVSFEQATRRSGADAHLRLLIGRAVFLIVLILGGITVLDALGFPLSTLVTVVGVIGIGVSLALQDILKNFFAGTYLLFERPFQIGDVISVKEQRGVVETIGVRTITLRTAENVQILVPNAMVFTEIVVNRTHERAPDETPASTGAVEADPLSPLPVISLPRPESIQRLGRLWKRLPSGLAGLRALPTRLRYSPAAAGPLAGAARTEALNPGGEAERSVAPALDSHGR